MCDGDWLAMRINLHLYHHFDPEDCATSLIDKKLNALLQVGVQLMTKADDANVKLDRINTATNNIAEDIRGLKVQAGMTQAEADAVNLRLESTATALEAIAAETPDAT